MIVSLNEIEAAALKAARGAGFAWGLAEEAAAAARWLAIAGADPVLALARLLDDRGPRARPRLEARVVDADGLKRRISPEVQSPIEAGLCPIVAGALMSDLGLDPGERFGLVRVLEPLLLLPFAARFATGRHAITVAIDGGFFALGPACVQSGEFGRLSRLVQAERVEVAVTKAMHGPARVRADAAFGYTVDDAAWRALDRLQALTYVPASQQSRLAGAGAGLSDND